MKLDLVLCGLGGQGIIFAGRLLSWIALKKRWPVIGAETHGMAQRGGSVTALLRFGPARGPGILPGSADCLISLSEDEAYRNLAFLRPGGLLFLNSPKYPRSQAREYLKRQKIAGQALDADDLALSHGLPRAVNLIMLGFALASGSLPLSRRELEQAVRAVSPERFREPNLKAVALGASGAGTEE